MRVFCYAYEGMYQGLHGIYDYEILDLPDDINEAINELNIWGSEASEQLIYTYGFENELEDGESIEDSPYYQDRGWEGYKIRDDVELSTEELDKIFYKLEVNDFIKEYCEEDPI